MRLARCKKRDASDALWVTLAMGHPKDPVCEFNVHKLPHEEENNMNSLFRYPQPDRAHLLVHLTLGLAAVMAVVSAVTAMIELSADRDRIAVALSTGSRTVVCTEPGERNSLTNVGETKLTPADPGSRGHTNQPSIEPAVSHRNDLPTG